MFDWGEDDFNDDDFNLPTPIAKSNIDHIYQFDGGINVKFPYKAYPSQEAMMNKIIRGVNDKKHCLLESPTGTGKTAALLCSLLAWQENEKSKIDVEADPEFEPKHLASLNRPNLKHVELIDLERTLKKKSLPVIYYATRTQSQIQTVINQFKVTKYSTTPMALLGSRKYTCIDKDALAGSADETCEQYIKNAVKIHHENAVHRNIDEPDINVSQLRTCKYYELPKKLGGSVSHPSKQFLDLPKGRNFEAWDIEDLKSFGENCNKCPYFGTKVLKEDASIVFLTYNYLLYPQIRKSSKIILENNIVVFDEAHNIEDICREVGSNHLNLKHLTDVINKELSKSVQRDDIPERKEQPLKDLRAVFSKLASWLSNELKNGEGFTEVHDDTPNQETFKKDLSGTVAVKTFDDIGFGPDQLRQLWVAYYIIEDKSYFYDFDPIIALFKVDRNCMNAIRKFLSALHFLYKREHDNFINLNDYQILLVKKRKRFALPYKNQRDANQSSSHFHYGDSEIELHLICLSPAIAFKRIKEARTVIVTSGTLSPLTSFESELNTKFDYQLSAKHVLKPDRVFAAIISKYQIDSETLNFNYDFQKCERKFDQHQQDMANVILDLCQLVNHGILVFVPSKSVMQRFQRTWTVNGNLEKIKQLKDVFIESDCGGNAAELQTMITTYREKVEQSRGAILFAILRGRISEGIDFKDNQARCVITIGIPFLPWRDDKITAKRAYNDIKCASRSQNGHSFSYLDGRQWYTMQWLFVL